MAKWHWKSITSESSPLGRTSEHFAWGAAKLLLSIHFWEGSPLLFAPCSFFFYLPRGRLFGFHNILLGDSRTALNKVTWGRILSPPLLSPTPPHTPPQKELH